MSADLYLIAQVAGRAVAVDTAQVESVIEMGEIVPAPGALPGVAGLFALRSRVVTVIDTRFLLGQPAADTPPPRAIITRVDGHHYAVLVDALEDIAPYASAPLAQRGSGAWAAVGRGVIERDGEPVLVIDLAAIVPGLPLAA